jgi:hypothetical protein
MDGILRTVRWPKTYLLHATRAALENPGTVTLPHALLTS